MKICPHCDKQWEDGLFCALCGEKLKDYTEDALFSAELDALIAMAEEHAGASKTQEEMLAPFEVEVLPGGKYIVTALKNGADMIVTVPDGVQAIGEGAFEGSDVIEVSLPEGLLKIEARAFADCTDLDTVNFPNSLKIIGEEAFDGCTSLNVTPPSHARIGADAFRNTVLYGADEEARAEEDERAFHRVMQRRWETEFDPYFNGFGSLDTCTIQSVKDKSIETVEIPPFVNCIQEFAFSECKQLRNVRFSNVTALGNAVFNGCERLESIALPFGIATIPDGMFYGCESLTSFSLLGFPGSVKSIERVAFAKCRSLDHIDLPAGLKLLDDWAFLECSSLKSITVPEWIYRIGYGAFCGCRSLASVTLNPRLEVIAGRAFDGCESLTEITIPDTVRVIGEEAFNKCYRLRTAHVPEHLRAQFEAALEPSVRQEIQFV